MTTLKDIEKEIVEEFDRYQETNWQDMNGGDLVEVDPHKWFTAALDRVAVATKEAVGTGVHLSKEVMEQNFKSFVE